MRNSISICFFFLGAVCAPSSAASFSWAAIGNTNNAADPATNLGSVTEVFQISKTEVTNAQYAEFLNGVDPTGGNALQLYANDMAGTFGGILNNGAIDGARYLVKTGQGQEPVSNVSWFDSIRFINWLHNGQGNANTESGAYTLLGGTPTPSNAATISRHVDAKFWLPNQNEWYKAAFHNKVAGTSADYNLYATGSNVEPISDMPTDDPSAVNYFNNDGIANGFNEGYAISGSNLPTVAYANVGAYFIAESPYGTFDQNGSVAEWNETLTNATSRGIRGGSWFEPLNSLKSTTGNQANPSTQSGFVGFRIATLIPEPSSLILAVISGVGLCCNLRKNV